MRHVPMPHTGWCYSYRPTGVCSGMPCCQAAARHSNSCSLCRMQAVPSNSSTRRGDPRRLNRHCTNAHATRTTIQMVGSQQGSSPPWLAVPVCVHVTGVVIRDSPEGSTSWITTPVAAAVVAALMVNVKGVLMIGVAVEAARLMLNGICATTHTAAHRQHGLRWVLRRITFELREIAVSTKHSSASCFGFTQAGGAQHKMFIHTSF